MSLIAVPTRDEIPSDLRPAGRRTTVRPKLPEIDAADLPTVIGQRLLVLPAVPPTETDSGLALATDVVKHLNTLNSIGVVLALGDLAFSTVRGYPAGYAPLKVGDWVNFHSSAGQSVSIRDRNGDLCKIRYLNDNDVLGIATDPSAFMVVV